jgi:hypothetical protein
MNELRAKVLYSLVTSEFVANSVCVGYVNEKFYRFTLNNEIKFSAFSLTYILKYIHVIYQLG